MSESVLAHLLTLARQQGLAHFGVRGLVGGRLEALAAGVVDAIPHDLRGCDACARLRPRVLCNRETPRVVEREAAIGIGLGTHLRDVDAREEELARFIARQVGW